ncbi:MAG: hypothetical protein ABIL01_15645 [Pseudomonadota bacterium]
MRLRFDELLEGSQDTPDGTELAYLIRYGREQKKIRGNRVAVGA